MNINKFYLASIGILASISIWLFSFETASASVTYSRSSSGASVSSPVSFDVSFTNFAQDVGETEGTVLCNDGIGGEQACRYWGVMINGAGSLEVGSGESFPSTTLSGHFEVDLPVGFDATLVSFIYCFNQADCNAATPTGTPTTGGGAYLEGNGTGVIFRVLAAQSLVVGVGSAAPEQYGPKIKITSPEGGIFSSSVEIKYEAVDANDTLNIAANRFGLGNNPVLISYSDTVDVLPEGRWIYEEDKSLIAEKQPASGSFLWDTSKLPDGDDYRVIVEAYDLFGDKGETASQKFSIDRSPPTFNVIAEPAFSRGEDVNIIVEPSEELSEPPFVEAQQREFALRQILMSRIGTSTSWEGNYQIVPGFDGPAKIFVSGKDKAGNKGNIVAKGGRFSVGIEPPPKPVIISPADKEIVSSDSLTIRGKAREDTEAVLLVNSKDEYKTKPDGEGNFIFENIKLNAEFQNGINFLSIASRDAAGNVSESVGFSIKFNLGPDLKIIFPEGGASLTGSSTLRILASDKNNDRLLFTYEVSRDGGQNWSLLAGNIAAKSYVWPTFNFPDGDYLLRVQANDGSAKAEATSSPFKIANFLPVISFSDGERTVSGSPNVALKGRIVSPESSVGQARADIITLEYSLDGGATWVGASAADGIFNSPEENFAVNFQNLKEGLYKILFRGADARRFFGRTSKTLIVDFGPPAAPNLKEVQPPIISDRDDEDPSLTGVQFIISGKSEPESTVKAILGSNEYSAKADSSGEFRVRATLKDHGKNEFTFFVTDLAENKSPEIKFSFIYNNPPKLKFLNPREGKGLNHKAGISWEITDPDGDAVTSLILSFRKGSGEFKGLTADSRAAKFSWDVSNLSAGSDYELKLEASDGVSLVEERRRFFVDNAPPQIKIEPLSKTSFNKAFTLALAGSASDDFSGIEFVEYSIDGERWFKAVVESGFLAKSARFSLKHPLSLEDGEYSLLVRAVDASGNTSPKAEQKFAVDTTPPRVGSFRLSKGNIVLMPEEQIFKILADTKILLAISLEKDTSAANLILSTSDIRRSLRRNQSIGLWEAELEFSEIGIFDLLISAEDALGNKIRNKKIGEVEAVGRGKTEPGATINILVKNAEDQVFKRWLAEGYEAANPVISDERGEYELLLPDGQYQILVKKSEFQRLRTSEFELLVPRFINFDFTLEPRTGLRGAIEDLLEKLNFEL